MNNLLIWYIKYLLISAAEANSRGAQSAEEAGWSAYFTFGWALSVILYCGHYANATSLFCDTKVKVVGPAAVSTELLVLANGCI